MTRDKLNRNLSLLRALRKNKDLRAALESAAGPGAQVLSGLPHAPGYRNQLGELAAEIADVSAEITRIQTELAALEPEISAFTVTIHDSQTRMIFHLRFQRGMSWREIARAVGGGNTASGVRMICRRYMKKRHI